MRYKYKVSCGHIVASNMIKTARQFLRCRYCKKSRQVIEMMTESIYPARISHATTREQEEALRDLSREAARKTGRITGVPITAVIRAACAICLSDESLRAKVIESAIGPWR